MYKFATVPLLFVKVLKVLLFQKVLQFFENWLFTSATALKAYSFLKALNTLAYALF